MGCRRLLRPVASGNQQQAGQKRCHHIPFRVYARLFLQRPLTLIRTSNSPLRYAYKALELNHYQAIQRSHVLLDLDRRLREDL